ncbi:unnamed protein product [Vitrella brassicaformis CCMP3155]|uniref:Uncharacterized protein n=2 Tax=Vitrella brassicaformis TaxID=1169539 RepID=A0A0G4EYB4_VITBC|nr:unnamed protein product [Vitrella brassicaformis CCMP3155]|eukprot:CEM04130.1 unnamed protein product [Vitrella brassicaformis CCMP3155]
MRGGGRQPLSVPTSPQKKHHVGGGASGDVESLRVELDRVQRQLKDAELRASMEAEASLRSKYELGEVEERVKAREEQLGRLREDMARREKALQEGIVRTQEDLLGLKEDLESTAPWRSRLETFCTFAKLHCPPPSQPSPLAQSTNTQPAFPQQPQLQPATTTPDKSKAAAKKKGAGPGAQGKAPPPPRGDLQPMPRQSVAQVRRSSSFAILEDFIKSYGLSPDTDMGGMGGKGGGAAGGRQGDAKSSRRRSSYHDAPPEAALQSSLVRGITGLGDDLTSTAPMLGDARVQVPTVIPPPRDTTRDSKPPKTAQEALEAFVRSVEQCVAVHQWSLKEALERSYGLKGEVEALREENRRLKGVVDEDRVCIRCEQTYRLAENHANACTYHPGKIKFFSCMSCGGAKYWTCCNKCSACSPGCRTGFHVS